MKGGDGGGTDWLGLQSGERSVLHFPKGAIKNWKNLDDIEVFIQPNVGYVTNYLTLAAVNEDSSWARTTLPATYPMGRIDKHLFAMGEGNFRVENVIDYLDQPGEWVINTQEELCIIGQNTIKYPSILWSPDLLNIFRLMDSIREVPFEISLSGV